MAGSRCGAYWLFKLIYIAFLLCFIAVFIFWLIFRPKEVEFHVTDATLTQFYFNTTDNTLYYNLSANITLRNPNKRVGINYNSIEAIAKYQNKLFSNVGLTPFYQGHKNTSILRPVFVGQKDMSLRARDLSKMDEEKSAGVFGIDIKLSVQISINYGKFKTFKFEPTMIYCPLKVPLSDNGTVAEGFKTTQCDDVNFFSYPDDTD
ncbi:NDR1/HIN1-like protein 10 [Castanea sativa]|uniref:NDR1/HIN1-like protein 10 n=1 Tax=Castanea sativa TaxID=21020 RepID=UPI003F64E1E2